MFQYFNSESEKEGGVNLAPKFVIASVAKQSQLFEKIALSNCCSPRNDIKTFAKTAVILFCVGFLFSLVILLGLPVVASAASTTYYVDSTRSVDTGNGLTPATACQKINTCVAKGSSVAPTGTNAGEGHIYKLSGTFTEYVIVASANQSGATFTGCTDNSFADCTVNARDLVVQRGPNTN